MIRPPGAAIGRRLRRGSSGANIEDSRSMYPDWRSAALHLDGREGESIDDIEQHLTTNYKGQALQNCAVNLAYLVRSA